MPFVIGGKDGWLASRLVGNDDTMFGTQFRDCRGVCTNNRGNLSEGVVSRDEGDDIIELLLRKSFHDDGGWKERGVGSNLGSDKLRHQSHDFFLQSEPFKT